MMLIIGLAVISRGVFNKPLIGDYELVSISMVILIGLGLAYAESIDSHIKVGLIVDRFSEKTQTIIDIFVYLLVFVIATLIGVVQFKAAINGMTNLTVVTPLLSIPHYPLQFGLAMGFILWGLEAFLKIVYNIMNLFNRDVGSEV